MPGQQEFLTLTLLFMFFGIWTAVFCNLLIRYRHTKWRYVLFGIGGPIVWILTLAALQAGHKLPR